jgi:hypothetical protein
MILNGNARCWEHISEFFGHVGVLGGAFEVAKHLGGGENSQAASIPPLLVLRPKRSAVSLTLFCSTAEPRSRRLVHPADSSRT